ncbi:exocyst complex component 4 [Ixodes scapularis]|uniref:exocyst complex component 4 n=1 Tax=Ixodes scapularis TaxID=6945 RepID=UPI001161B2FB|nr:exocyst complex component 4 [Ixodes scapularis]
MANYTSGPGGPVRPPRTFKTSKDSNGLLISVIRSLSASQNSADRDREKAKLEKDFKRSDQKLDDMVAQNKEDLTRAMQAFSKISSRITVSRDKIQCIKEKLTTCKILLHCKRDELKKLWLEAVEHKRVLELLEEIESLVEVPEKVDAFLEKRQYLHATQLLVSSVHLVEGSLEGVEALKDVRAKLLFKKERLHEDLVEELHRQLYMRGEARLRRPLPPTPQPFLGTLGELLRLDEGGERQGPPFLAILVHCLALLQRIPDTLQVMKERCQSELLSMVWRSSQFLVDNNRPTPALLVELLELLFEQFRWVVAAHGAALGSMQALMASQGLEYDAAAYGVSDVWFHMQSVVEYIVGKYLDVHNSSGAQQVAAPALTDLVANNDLASCFTRRRNAKPKKFALFRFDCSSHAISMSTYLKEQMEELRDESGYVEVDDTGPGLVCTPASRNVTYIFKPLMAFVGEMEAALGLPNGQHCQLYGHLLHWVDVFLAHVNNDLDNAIDAATKSLETWKVTSEPEILKSLGVLRPLLQSTVCVDHSLQGLEELMQALPMYVEHFLGLACTILHNYKETSQVAYRGIVQPESEDKRIISATWAKDEDISRFLMSLPNWANLQQPKESDVQESPEEVRLRNKKESEILIGNLASGTLIPQHEILADVAQLRVLAQLHESLEWLSGRVQRVAASRPQDTAAQALGELARDFQDVADTCLLVLHLEVRVHCFYYLLPVTIQGNFASGVDSQEPDPEVIKLTKDLSSMDEAMTACLQQRKHRYIFEGLGHLIASILINSASSIQKVNENGIKKVCRNIFAMQQNLTSITMNREVALDYARQYFELLYHSPEDVLNLIVEHGCQFQEAEYRNVLVLLHRSLPSGLRSPEALEALLARLRDILNEVAVAI